MLAVFSRLRHISLLTCRRVSPGVAVLVQQPLQMPHSLLAPLLLVLFLPLLPCLPLLPVRLLLQLLGRILSGQQLRVQGAQHRTQERQMRLLLQHCRLVLLVRAGCPWACALGSPACCCFCRCGRRQERARVEGC